MNQKVEKTDGEQEDYIWRFKLAPASDDADPGDPLLETARIFLADLLNIAQLTCNGETVEVDGFAFTNDPETVHEIYPPDQTRKTKGENGYD